LDDRDQGQAPRGRGRLSVRQEQGGKQLIGVQRAQFIAEPQIAVTFFEGGAGHTRGSVGDGADGVEV